MRITLLGKRASITHWLEKAAEGFAAAGCEVRLAWFRNPTFHPAIDAAMAAERFGAPMAGRIAAGVRKWRPRLVLVIGGFQAPTSVLERLRSQKDRPPLVGWVGDVFGAEAAPVAALYDLVAYADSALLARHGELGFPGEAMWLPHAASAPIDPAPSGPRGEEIVFIANPTPRRRAILKGLSQSISLYGPSWRPGTEGEAHLIFPRRIAPREVTAIYARCVAALNIRNEGNLLDGLNQRNFEPCLAGAAVLSDDQPDLARCFEPGREVLIWRDGGELDALCRKLRREPDLAERVGDAGRRRVLADHGYDKRLEAILARLA
ncbi:MAG: CgeB family protein [Caulobacteraceae bacterium]